MLPADAGATQKTGIMPTGVGATNQETAAAWRWLPETTQSEPNRSRHAKTFAHVVIVTPRSLVITGGLVHCCFVLS